MAEALRLWEGMDERVGRPTGFSRSGILYTCRDEATIAERRGLGRVRSTTTSSSTDADAGGEFAALRPARASPVKGALLHPRDGRAEPQKAAPAIAERGAPSSVRTC